MAQQGQALLGQCVVLWRLIQQLAMAWSCQAGKAGSATAFLCCTLCRVPQPRGCSFHDAERGSGCQGKCLPVHGVWVEELAPTWLYLTLPWCEWDQHRDAAQLCGPWHGPASVSQTVLVWMEGVLVTPKTVIKVVHMS